MCNTKNTLRSQDANQRIIKKKLHFDYMFMNLRVQRDFNSLKGLCQLITITLTVSIYSNLLEACLQGRRSIDDLCDPNTEVFVLMALRLIVDPEP